MSFKSNFTSIVFPDDTGKPCVARYRLVFSASTERHAIIHLVQSDTAFPDLQQAPSIRDDLLNRILDAELRGVLVKYVRLVVDIGTLRSEYAITVDLDDYVHRGNPFVAGQIQSSGSHVHETISIMSDQIVVGCTRVQTVDAVARSLSVELAKALS